MNYQPTSDEKLVESDFVKPKGKHILLIVASAFFAAVGIVLTYLL